MACGSSQRSTESTGPKISSRAIVMSWVTSAKTVGSRKQPAASPGSAGGGGVRRRGGRPVVVGRADQRAHGGRRVLRRPGPDLLELAGHPVEHLVVDGVVQEGAA